MLKGKEQTTQKRSLESFLIFEVKKYCQNQTLETMIKSLSQVADSDNVTLIHEFQQI